MIENNSLQILSSFEIFKGLTEVELKEIHTKCQRVKFKESEILMKEGQINSAIYIIIKGQVEVCLPDKVGKQNIKGPQK